MKKVRRYWYIFVIAIFLLLAMAGRVFMLYISWARWNGTYVHYEGRLYSSNEVYTGLIDLSKERVSILDQSKKEVSSIDIKGDRPDQIVLGKTTYFLLYRWDNDNGNGDGDAKIVQYDYQSVKRQEYMAQNTDVINYKDGYLFMGTRNWGHKYGFTSCDYAFYANNYIKEEDFGQQPEQLKAAASGNCMIGNTEWYYHEGGYFSTEPALNDYPGLSKGTFRTSDKNYQVKTKQEIKNRSLLLSEIGRISGAVYEVFEYQMANDIYGLCNVYEEGEYVSSLPTEPEDVKAAYFYKINPKENEITILLKKDSCIGFILSNNEAVYQENNRIMHHDFKTENEKEIYQINNEHDMKLYVKKGYLMVVEEKKRAFPFAAIFPTDEEVNHVVKWELLPE